MKIMIIVGARPNFMKAAPIVSAIRAHNGAFSALESAKGRIDTILVHTGQHYDDGMSGAFFMDLGLPEPDFYLGVGSGSHAMQTAEIMRQFEGVVLSEKPDAVIVVGDVNSTLGCALVASKIAFPGDGDRPLIAHVEAGLRSFDRAMPEEINRVITDHLSDLLFVTEESGIRNLQNEGITPDAIHFVGNTMIDSLLASQEKAKNSSILVDFGLNGSTESTTSVHQYVLLTLHRPSNVDNREVLLPILEGLQELSSSYPILFPMHPRTRRRIAEFGLEHFFSSGDVTRRRVALHGIHVLEPLGYLEFLCLMRHAALVVTDSGGIQEETTCLRVPCVTVRNNTERPVTVTCGTNTIAGTTKQGIQRAVKKSLEGYHHAEIPDYWDGKAAERIVKVLVSALKGQRSISKASGNVHGDVSAATSHQAIASGILSKATTEDVRSGGERN
jgi:UDP-N-acetylglucosamine 2-epimerase (non-hydrolysing)